MAVGVVRISTIFDHPPTAETIARFDPSVNVDYSKLDDATAFTAHVDVDCPTHTNSSTVTSAEMTDDKALAIMRARCPGAAVSRVDVRQVG